MRAIVCGSRQYPLPDLVRNRVRNMADGTTILVGRAPTPKGKDPALNVDRVAEHEAHSRGFAVEPYPPDFARHGRRAPHVRNDEMLDASPDLLIAFHDGISSGTASMLAKARLRLIPVEVWGPDGHLWTVQSALEAWRRSQATLLP